MSSAVFTPRGSGSGSLKADSSRVGLDKGATEQVLACGIAQDFLALRRSSPGHSMGEQSLEWKS